MSANPLHNEDAGGHGKPAASEPITAEQKLGLTTEQAEAATEKWGYNELPQVVVPLWWIFILQFTGTMPYMLELACVLSLVVQDYIDFAIIFLMVCCNGWLGFHEELKAAESLVCNTNARSLFVDLFITRYIHISM